MHTYIYVKLRYTAAQEVPLLEFHTSNFRKFCDRHIFLLFNKTIITCPAFIVMEWNFHHLDAKFFYSTN